MIASQLPQMSNVSPYTETPENSALILVADDDELIRKMLRHAIEIEGYQVIEADNGKKCLQACKQVRPDLILLDAMMPVMDGFTCCQRLSELPATSNIPILMITALENSESVDNAFAAGATDYITKPIRWPVLRQRLRRLLQASKAAAELKYQTERERLMNVMLERIRQSLNLKDILHTAVAEVRDFLATDRVLIYRFHANGSGTVIEESVADDYIPMLGMQVTDSYCVEMYHQKYQKSQIASIENVNTANLQECHLEFLAKLQVKAYLVVLLLQGNQLWGLLIAHNCSSPRRWQQVEIDLMARLATQLAIAIQQSTLFEQLQNLNIHLEHQVEERTYQLQASTIQLQQALKFEALLKRITDKVRDRLDEKQILQTAVQELVLALGASCCNAALYNHDRNISVVEYEYTTDLAGYKGRIIEISKFSEIYQQLKQGKYFQFCSLTPNPKRGPVAMLACPMMNGDDTVGDLWLVNSVERVLNESEIRLVQQVANQCAIAIRQARLYQESQAHVAELEKLNQLKDDFLATVSHELRTPIATIKTGLTMIQLLINRQGPFRDKYKTIVKYLDILQTECEQEIKLINDLLTLQQLEAGEQPLTIAALELPTWLPHIIEPFIDRTRQENLSLHLELSPNLPLLFSNTFSVERILTELLTNACKHTPTGEEITVAAKTNGDNIEISVTNSGVEIPTDEIPKIFDKFYRIPCSDRWKQGGTGLGLALVKRLANHLGGSIEVTIINRKTCFTLQLPIHPH